MGDLYTDSGTQEAVEISAPRQERATAATAAYRDEPAAPGPLPVGSSISLGHCWLAVSRWGFRALLGSQFSVFPAAKYHRGQNPTR